MSGFEVKIPTAILSILIPSAWNVDSVSNCTKNMQRNFTQYQPGPGPFGHFAAEHPSHNLQISSRASRVPFTAAFRPSKRVTCLKQYPPPEIYHRLRSPVRTNLYKFYQIQVFSMPADFRIGTCIMDGCGGSGCSRQSTRRI